MKTSNINIEETIDKAKNLLAKEKNISPALRAVFKVLLLLVHTLFQSKKLPKKALKM